MEIKCTVEELKELIKNTSVAVTTDVNVKIPPLKNTDFLNKIAESIVETTNLSTEYLINGKKINIITD